MRNIELPAATMSQSQSPRRKTNMDHSRRSDSQDPMTDAAETGLNRLSCVRCKDRKVRCSRHEPVCERCKAQGKDCRYPVRQKRRSMRPIAPIAYSADRPASVIQNDTLSIILERLQRVEEQCIALPPPQASSSMSGGPESSTTSPYPMRHALPSIEEALASLPYAGLPSTLCNHVSPVFQGPATSTPSAGVDATAILKDAVDHVQRLRLQGYAGAVITEDITIPSELAKTWVKNYFAHMPTDMFMSLIDRKVIELVPDMMGLPHVHLDSCIIVIYYSVLWHGCAIASTGRGSTQSDLWRYTKSAYLGCLRALPGWQREATGTITDLIAAIAMARVSTECFDYEMAWKMYKQACEYAQGLDMHNLDEGDCGMGMGIHNPNISDHDRKAFWDLLQVDTFFRLLFNKPPSITGNVWKVNLPWLCVESQQAPQPVTAMTFLISSRVTLLLLRFFAMLEEERGDPSQMMARTEEMCAELKGLYQEWDLAKWVKDPQFNAHDTWIVADIALSGHTCIIFMLYKMAALDSSSPCPIATDSDVPDSAIAFDAASYIVEIVGWLLEKYPNSATMSNTFGAYRAYVPFAYLVTRILRASDVNAYRKDVENLDRAGRIVTEIALVERDFVPLARAIASLNYEVRKKVAAASAP